jgi:hypothetical protein
LRLDIQGSFNDAGAFDTHTASIDWGDGSSEELGSVTGAVSAGHVYMAAGEQTVAMAVTDDDGGVGAATMSINVLGASATAEMASATLEGILTGSHVHGAAAQFLEKALAKLEGNGHYTEPVGALDLLAGGQLHAALDKIRQATSYLLKAESVDSGLDLTMPKNLLAMTAKSLAVVQIHESASNPNLMAEAEKLLMEGNSLLAAGDQYGAIEKYEKALVLVLVFPDPIEL